jgi:glycosyltransferase involved in cell wall biosynthesis
MIVGGTAPAHRGRPPGLVVAVHPSAEMYGSDRMFLESVSALEGAALAVLPHHGPLAEALAARGVQCEIVPFPVLRRVALRSPLAVARFLGEFVVAVPRLARWLRRHGAEVVYVSTVIAPVWVFAGRLARRRVVCHVHESEPGMPRAASAVLLMPLRAAHRVIANSFATCGWIAGSAGRATGSRTAVVHNGVHDPATPETVAPPAGGRRRLVLVGRLSERKGQDVAVRALALLADQGHDAELVLVGDCFAGYEHVVTGLEDLVSDLGLADRVTFTGFSDPVPHLAAADVVLVPSRVEPFGLVAVEALLMARPVVASRVGGLPEIVADGSTGRLVDPGDPVALAAVIGELLADPARAASLGRSGREDARVRFSMATYASRLREAVHA